MKTKSLLTLLSVLLCISFTINLNAQEKFQRIYGGSSNESFRTLYPTNDGGYILGGSTNSFGGDDIYLVRTKSNGDTLWTKTYGGNNCERANSIVETSDGGFAMIGETDSYGAGLTDIYILRVDSKGNNLWAKTFGGSTWESGESIQQTSDGGFIAVGGTGSFGLNGDVYLIRTDANGNTLWTKTYGGTVSDWGYSVLQTADNGFIVAGITRSFSAGLEDVYVVRLDTSGNVLWTKTYGGIENDRANSISPTNDGGFIITGERQLTTNGFYDVYILRIDSIGDTLWTKTYGGALEEKGFSGNQTADGGFIFSGRTQTFAWGLSDAYLIRTDSNGDTLWTKTYGGFDIDECRSAYETSDGGFIIGGWIWGYGPGALDFYLIKTDSNGNSGCLESSTNTIAYNSTTVVGTGSTIPGIGVISFSPTFTTVNPPTVDSILCSTISSINEPVTNQVALQFYPNPLFSTYTTLEFENSKKVKHTLILYNSLGQLVRQIDNINEGQVKLEKKNLTSGLYFFQLRNDVEIVGTGKIIIE